MDRKIITYLSRPFINCYSRRYYKNFGHKRQPTPGITVLWHGFLTFTFIGLGLEWERIAKFMLGDDCENLQILMDPTNTVEQK